MLEATDTYAIVEWTGPRGGRALGCTATYDRLIVHVHGTAAHLEVEPALPSREDDEGRGVVRAYVPIPPGLDRPLEYRVVARVSCNPVHALLGGYRVEYPPVEIGADR